jgi:hypothetical protein
MINLKDTINDNLPFISVIHYGNNEYVGIIINQDSTVTSFYDLALVKLQQQLTTILELGEIWWWESNHRIPINIFLRQEMEQFQYAIKTFSNKDVKILIGPVVNLSMLANKRPKRKSVQLIKLPKN